MKFKIQMLIDLVKIYFRVRGSFWGSLAFQPRGKYEKYAYLAPGRKWGAFMCLLGKHDWDLLYSGPESCGLECNDCRLSRHTKVVDGVSVTQEVKYEAK